MPTIMHLVDGAQLEVQETAEAVFSELVGGQGAPVRLVSMDDSAVFVNPANVTHWREADGPPKAFATGRV